MPNCAVIDVATGRVITCIVADAEQDPPYPGTRLVPAADGEGNPIGVDSRWVWSEERGLEPGPELAAILAAPPEEGEGAP
jgi:hypothetical protein